MLAIPLVRQQTSPLSLAQERLWFIEQFAPGTATYNTPIVLELSGPLEPDVLERALGELVRRHEPLRTVFRSNQGYPVQFIQPCEAFILRFEDLRDVSCEDDIDRRIHDEIRRPIDLERGPIFRGCLLRLDQNRHVLALVVHHIAFDGWSMGVFLKELALLYAAFAAGECSPLPPLPTRYADFAVAEREQLSSPDADRQLAYWREHLAAPLPVLTLPTDHPRPAVQTSRGQSHEGHVPADSIARLQSVGRRNGATPFMVMAALYGMFLHRQSRQTDIIIGTAFANRTRRDVYPLIGFFANSLPLRLAIAPQMTIRELIAAIAPVAINAHDNQQVPLSRIVEAVNPPRDLSRSPIFQTLFTFNNTPHADSDSVAAGPLTMRRRFFSTGTAKAEVTLAMPRGAAGQVILETNADLFDAGTGTRLLAEFCALVAAAPEHVDARIDQLPAAGAPAITTIDEPPSTTPYPRDDTIARLFERQALMTPDAPAAVDGPVVLTYRELNERANRLAYVLHHRWRAVRDDESAVCFVGVCLERSLDAVVALLAILKTGGAYVPLDPAAPPARLTALSRRARLRLIVTNEGSVDTLAGTGADLIALDRDAPMVAAAPAANLPIDQNADALAYVLFTSGTTGTPKPVGVPHRAIVRLAYGLPAIPLGRGQTVLHASPMSFDAATFELWGPLLHGGCVAIAPPLMLGAAAVARTIAAHDVTVMWLTASLFNSIVDERVDALAPVRYLLTGGEKLSVPHVSRALAALPDTRLFNGYGPTEATTFTTCHEICVSDISNPSGIPIGKPLLNTQVYVLDDTGRRVAPGTTGELFIGGDGLALGYLDDADLTTARFVADPFARQHGARMYRTGDRARILADGTVEFLGRLDDQIKLRGFRIEPGEVEAAIGKCDAVAQCAVVAVDSPAAGRVLVACYVPAADAGDAASPRKIREFLRHSLPEYMIPGRFVQTERLPLLNTGKIDRQALKAQISAALTDRDEPPPTDNAPGGVSNPLAAIWRDVLGVAEARASDNFFDCGGHSLLAVQMLSRIEAAMGVAIGVRTLFEAPTLGALSLKVAELAEARAGDTAPAVDGGVTTAACPSAVRPTRNVPVRVTPATAAIKCGSASEITAGLIDIWCDLLEVNEVEASDGFFELGGHSLLAARLAAAIEQRFGVALPLSALFTHGTITAQTQLLVDALPAAEWTPIVPIQPNGDQRPLFLVHGIGGEVISFHPLARVLVDTPVYGLEADRRAGSLDGMTLEHVAATYAAAITEIDPVGPYRIGGYSAGGLIALEIAQQLQRAGRRVSSLIMLDAPARVTAQFSLAPAAIARLITNQIYWLADDDFLVSGLKAQRARLVQQMRKLWHGVAWRMGTDKASLRDRMGLWAMPASISPFLERLSTMLRDYQPRPYDGEITVIAARTHSLFITTDKDLGWRAFAIGGLRSRVVPGAHDTILREPRVAAVAAILQEVLREDQQASTAKAAPRRDDAIVRDR